MTACSSKLQSIAYKDEASFAEAVTTMTSAQILPGTVMADVSKLGPSFIDPGRVVQYKNERNAMIPGAFMNAEFTIEFELTGHGSTMVGSPALTAAENLMGWGLGAVVLTAAASTTLAAGSTVSSINTVSSGAHSPGGLFRIGTKGDAGGDGQWSVVDTCTTTVIVPEVALPAAPAAAAVLYGAANIHTVESSCSTGTSKRFRIMTADTQWVCHGCFQKGYSVTGGAAGEIMKVQLVIGVAWVEPVSATFPDVSSTAPWTYNAVPTAGGGLNLQTYGVATRNIVACRSFTVSVTLGIVPIIGYNGISTQQTIVGASRTPDDIKVSMIVDAEGPSATPTWWTAGATNAIWHALMGYSVGDGAAVACYLPRMRMTGNKPTQQDHEGLNRVALEFVAGTDTPETASELSLSAIRWGIA